ncbi:PRC-barrel domain-containing protein [Actinopolyspora saharensis]|uniref:PRC-barrel domain-containing protein n=1 Tax=Actinopolyspora saharensis TaxID=995062 RepID=A0A1H0ZZ85_9ACTN|nr:PRC-barrel domain-containing protein [Actinopolyspora saharensis]SDQ32356.1 PRC-barrel domain-containing protein [Actinopolyspora saharensis]
MSTAPHGPERSEGGRSGSEDLSGRTVVDRGGSRIGTLEQVYLAPDSGSPTWGVVRAGRNKQRFVPLHDANPGENAVRVSASKRQVRSSPTASTEPELRPEFEGRLTEHYSGAPNTARGSIAAVPRTRGAVSGSLLVLLGVWTALVPFVGPYFGYGFGSGQPWVFTADRLWLCVLPGVAILLGGFVMGPTGNRFLAAMGGSLALLGGAWLLVGPSLSRLWGTEGVATAIGSPLGSPSMWVWAQLGFFFAVGALVTALSSFALGRLSVRSVRD